MVLHTTKKISRAGLQSKVDADPGSIVVEIKNTEVGITLVKVIFGAHLEPAGKGVGETGAGSNQSIVALAGLRADRGCDRVIVPPRAHDRPGRTSWD